MGFFRGLGEIFGSVFSGFGASAEDEHESMFDHPVTNPATGLPTISGIGSSDIGGHDWGSSDGMFSSSSSSMFDDDDD